METSPELKQLTGALVKFQGSLELLKTNSIAKTEKYSFKYADLAAVWDTIRKPLSDNGFAVIQDPSVEGTQVTISTLLSHISGEWIKSQLKLTSEAPNPQKIGSAISYGRRYSLLSMLGLASEDDDGNAASGTKEAPVSQAPAATNGETAAQKRMREAKEAAAKQQGAVKTQVPANVPAQPPVAGAKATKTPAEIRSEIDTLCLDMSFGDLEVAGQNLEAITAWEAKQADGTVKRLPGKKQSSQISDKAVGVVLGKVRKAHEAWLKENTPPSDGEAVSQ